MTTTELARVESRIPRAPELADLGKLANYLARSGFFKDAHGGYQAFAKLLFGRDLGLSATAAMTGVHIVEGKPEIGANVQAQMVNTYVGPEGERYRYRVREHDNAHCKLEFFQRERGKDWESLGEYEYTMQDAERAQLAGRGTWKKHPRNMLFARAMSDGVAFKCPEVTNGVRVYREGEIDVIGGNGTAPSVEPQDIPLDGKVVDAEVVSDGAPGEPAADSEPEKPARTRSLPKAILSALEAARGEAGVPDAWLRMQLVAIGVEDVPDEITRGVLSKLTVEQAQSLQSVLNGAVDAKAAQA